MDTQTREPTTIGEMLSEEFLKPLNITQQQLADVMGVSRKVIRQIINNQCRLKVEDAVKLADLFELDDSFWINLQAAHDRWESHQLSAKQHIQPITALLAH